MGSDGSRAGRVLARASAVVTLALAGLGPALAQAAAPGDPPDLTGLSLEQLMEIEVATVYGASRHLEKVSDAPALVTIVTAEDIRRFGYRTLAEILRSVGGFYVTNDRNYTYIGVRGFGPPSDYNNRILVLIDNHRLNDNIYDGVLVGNDFPLDVDLIDRVEVIRGPSSALYGSNAFFAVVNVITRRAADIAPLELSASAGSRETYTGRASYAVTLAGGGEVVLSASLFDSAGNERLFYREFVDPPARDGIARDADEESAYSLFGSFRRRGFTLQGLVASREKAIPTGSFGTIFGDTRNRTEDVSAYVDLRYEHAFANGLGLLARVYYDRTAYYARYVFDQSETDEPLAVVNRDTSTGEWVGAELQLSGEVARWLRLTGGAEYQYHFRQDQESSDVDPPYVHLHDHRSSSWWGTYGQAEARFHRRLSLIAGGRYDHYEEFGGHLSPRAAVVYHPGARTTLKLLYGEAFRAPNAYERYYTDETDFVRNPDLDPETIRTTELVLEHYLTPRLRGFASVFHSWIDDLISQAENSDGTISFRNLEGATTRGLDLGLEGRLPWWDIEARAYYTLQETVDDRTDQALTNSPRHLVKLAVAIPLFRDWATLGTELQYTDRRRTLRGGHVSGYWLGNVTLFSQKLHPRLTASLGVYNVFDQRYRDPGSAEHAQDGIAQDGRSFRLKLTYRF